ncbi:MAG: vitamin B12 dependent-methionine synthase activation domain-containing protein, partial [Advenella sp.]
HRVKIDMFKVLQTEYIVMQLTDGMAMYPASSVSGFYLSHPASSYFNVGTIGQDQLQDYIARSGLAEEDVRRSLMSVLG